MNGPPTDHAVPAAAAPGSAARAGSGPAAAPQPVVGDASSLPSHAELARTLVAAGGHGTLATLVDGHPYGSLVAFVADGTGAPYLCISELAEHTHNARADARASLLVTSARVPSGDDPLAHPRLTVLGALTPVEPPAEVRERYLARHPRAALYVSYGDFGWWRLAVERARYVGGFGVMGWVDRATYEAAEPDPVIPEAARIIAHMNADHAEACLLYARHLAGIDGALHATLVAVDRRGMTLHVDTADAKRTARVAFERPVGAAGQVRTAAIALLERARARAAGTDGAAHDRGQGVA